MRLYHYAPRQALKGIAATGITVGELPFGNRVDGPNGERTGVWFSDKPDGIFGSRPQQDYRFRFTCDLPDKLPWLMKYTDYLEHVILGLIERGVIPESKRGYALERPLLKESDVKELAAMDGVAITPEYMARVQSDPTNWWLLVGSPVKLEWIEPEIKDMLAGADLDIRACQHLPGGFWRPIAFQDRVDWIENIRRTLPASP